MVCALAVAGRLEATPAKAIIYSLGSFKAKCDVLRAVTMTLPEDDRRRRRIIPLIDEAQKLSGRRNDVLHGLWTITDEDQKPWLIVEKPANKIKTQAFKKDLKELEDLAEAICLLSYKFIGTSFRRELPDDQLGPLPRRFS